MQKAELLKYIRHPERLDRESLDKILKVKEFFPYFQTVRLLAVKNRFLLGDEGYQADIESTAAYVTDRRVLYDLLYPLSDIPETDDGIDADADASLSPAPPTLRDNISNLLSLQLEEFELMDPSEAELVPEIAVDIDKTYRKQDISDPDKIFTPDTDLLTLDTDPEPEATADTATPADGDVPAESGSAAEEPPLLKIAGKELIEKFIENNPRLQPRQDDRPHVDISEDSVKEHDGIFTDTLAKIYIKQRYYSKAIFVYEKLILKYPEKSDYFAGQIAAIKKLTNKQ